MPTVRFLKKLNNREEERKKKNVDYRLLKLKDEIKAERLEKKIANLGDGGKEEALKKARKAEKKKKRSRDSDDSDDDDDDDDNAGLLVVKKVHEWGDKSSSQPLPQVHLDEASRSRHAKKIRVDGSSMGVNQKTVFNDDGDVQEDMIHEVEDAAAATAMTTETDTNALASAREEYLQKVRNRLSETKELDRKEEKERIQAKHKKRKLKEKGEDTKKDENEEEDGDGGAVVTLGGQYSDDEDPSSDEEKSESSDDDEEEDGKNTNMESLYDEDSDDVDDVDSDEEDVDVKAQEELALAMLGN